MSRWEKILDRMAASRRCAGFTYKEAAAVLEGLGFVQAQDGSSHRRWVLLREGHPAVIIGLVDKGHGEIKPVYIKTLVEQLRAAGLLSDEELGR